MLKVKTKLKESVIHGVGLFADEFIPKDTLIFEEDIFTIKYTSEDIKDLSEEHKNFLETYGYLREGTWYCSLDNDRFMNHSDNPNTYEKGSETYSSIDIQQGDEITTNYNEVCEMYKQFKK